MPGKGAWCPDCERYTMVLRRDVLRCRNCHGLRWTPFDRPEAGRSKKGSTCHHCHNQTVHLIGVVSDAEVRRRSICGVTHVLPRGGT